MPRPLAGTLIAAGLVAASGALFAAPMLFAAGYVVAFAVLALHPVLTGSAQPKAIRLLVRAGLLGSTVAALLQAWTLATSLAALRSGVFTFDSDPQRLRAEALGAVAAASAQLLACTAFAASLVLLPPPRPRAALTGLAILVPFTVIGAASAAEAWSSLADPLPPSSLPPESTSNLPANVAVTTSVTMAVDPIGAALIGLVLFGTYLLVDGLRRT
ncbi:hypothetical protein AB0M02_39835 [Actinoplanes sp. NPDC051861]|uniref:hypothetical protein n=1 Tax=Actinoplanes sp. NPDC051861 TaxID=3155170 RepID=UPI003419EA2B